MGRRSFRIQAIPHGFLFQGIARHPEDHPYLPHLSLKLILLVNGSFSQGFWQVLPTASLRSGFLDSPLFPLNQQTVYHFFGGSTAPLPRLARRSGLRAAAGLFGGPGPPGGRGRGQSPGPAGGSPPAGSGDSGRGWLLWGGRWGVSFGSTFGFFVGYLYVLWFFVGFFGFLWGSLRCRKAGRGQQGLTERVSPKGGNNDQATRVETRNLVLPLGFRLPSPDPTFHSVNSGNPSLRCASRGSSSRRRPT